MASETNMSKQPRTPGKSYLYSRRGNLEGANVHSQAQRHAAQANNELDDREPKSQHQLTLWEQAIVLIDDVARV